MIALEIILLKLVVIDIFEVAVALDCLHILDEIGSIGLDMPQQSDVDLITATKVQGTVTPQIEYFLCVQHS